ncbi:MAG: DUF885 domain-containing protein [Longimicrobiales bacterium]
MSETEVAQRVTELADQYVAAYFDAFPHQATLVGASNADHGRLPDISLEARALWEAKEDSLLESLRAIDANALAAASPAATTYHFLSTVLENAIAFRQCRMELWNVSPTWTGWQAEMALLANSQPVGTDAQNQAAIRRFSELPRYLDQEIANLREGLRLGYSEPKHNVQSVIDQMDALLSAPIDDSPFVAMASDSIASFRAEMRRLESDALRPAITRYRDFLRDEYLPAAREAIGVSANPEGPACYAVAVRYHATVDMSPEEVHRTGLEQMEKIRSEMTQIAQRSFATSDLDALLDALKTDRQYLMAGREDMLRLTQAAIDRAREAVPQWFGIVPKAQVAVEPVAAFQEKSAPGGFYNAPAEDGSRPGIYYINLYEADQQPRAGLESTAFHETYPGHHLQGAIALERTGLHPIGRYIFLSGFGEGWGLYSERLADEMGLFSDDIDRLGLLSAEAHRAARLVVDPGMHALGWSRQQAIDYMLANTALSRSSAESEIDRYLAVPGQATSYMLGNLEIRRLRAMAEDSLGERFDIRTFHDRVLEDGAVPLSVLRAKIVRWVRETPR